MKNPKPNLASNTTANQGLHPENTLQSLTRRATKRAKEILKSQEEVDSEKLEALTKSFDAEDPAPLSDIDAARMRFVSALESTIDVKFAEIMSSKPESSKTLTFVNGQTMTAAVRNVFRSALQMVPRQIEAACLLSEAIIAPSASQRIKLLKSVIGIAGGASGIGLILAGIGVALGWSSGVIAAIIVFFTGNSFAGPIGLIVVGTTITGIAVYFARTSNDERDTERFLKALKASTGRAVEAIWQEHGAALKKVIDNDSTSR